MHLEAVLDSVERFRARVTNRRDGIALAQLTLDQIDALDRLGEDPSEPRARAGAKVVLFGNDGTSHGFRISVS